MSDKRKRLTANEVAEPIDEIGSTAPLRVEPVINDVAQLVRDNLTPRWQDAPDVDGWYWVEGIDEPRFVKLNHGKWLYGDDEHMAYGYDLNNRRVCPIGERPEADE